MFNRDYRKTIQKALAEYDRATILRQLGEFQYRIADAMAGCMCFGGTGAGKTSVIAHFFMLAYLAYGFGGLVLCVKPEERRQWEEWAALTGRSHDLVIVNPSGSVRFNPFEWEAMQPTAGGGLTVNIVSLLLEIAVAVSGGSGRPSGGDAQFFEDCLRHLLTNAVDLCLFSGQRLTLPLLREIIVSAPQSLDEVKSEEWQATSACWNAMRLAASRKAQMNPDELADCTETLTYFTRELPSTSYKTRTIFTLMAAQLMRPFTARPLRSIFCRDSTIRPEDCFAGKIILVDLATQDFKESGRVAAMTFKACFQAAVMRRAPAPQGQHLRPAFLYLDECQALVSERDAAYQAVARSAGGCTFYLTQNINGLRRALGSDDAVEALLGNLQCKIFMQNSSPDTNAYASRLLGERYKEVTHGGISFSDQGGGGHRETAEQRRAYVEPAEFARLKKAGPPDFEAEVIIYNGGQTYALPDSSTRKVERVPFIRLSIPQKG